MASFCAVVMRMRERRFGQFAVRVTFSRGGCSGSRRVVVNDNGRADDRDRCSSPSGTTALQGLERKMPGSPSTTPLLTCFGLAEQTHGGAPSPRRQRELNPPRDSDCQFDKRRHAARKPNLDIGTVHRTDPLERRALVMRRQRRSVRSLPLCGRRRSCRRRSGTSVASAA